MVSTKSVDQLSFAGQFQWGKIPDFSYHPLVKLEKGIDWPEMYSSLLRFYKPRGRNAIPLKHMVLLLLVKHMEGCSDAEVVSRLATDLVWQCALNLPMERCKLNEYFVNTKRSGKVRKISGYIAPSSLSAFRNRLGDEGIEIMERIVYNSLKNSNKKKVVG